MKTSVFGATMLVAASAATVGVQAQETATAIFAGGCFWSIESDFDHAPGVIDTVSGYTGGHVENPTYQQVITETTGHREAVKVTYDPAVTSYEKLLDAYWHMIDPIQTNGQFCDFGESYTTAIYASSEDERALAEASKAEVGDLLGKRVATEIAIAPTFWPAEDYHQNFWKGTAVLSNGLTQAEHYARYRAGCGKNRQVEAIWGADAFKGLDGHA